MSAQIVAGRASAQTLAGMAQSLQQIVSQFHLDTDSYGGLGVPVADPVAIKVSVPARAARPAAATNGHSHSNGNGRHSGGLPPR